MKRHVSDLQRLVLHCSWMRFAVADKAAGASMQNWSAWRSHFNICIAERVQHAARHTPALNEDWESLEPTIKELVLTDVTAPAGPE